jgi:hypothetical protein
MCLNKNKPISTCLNIMNNLDHELHPKNLSGKLSPTVENVRRSCRAVANSPQCTVKIDETRAREVIDNIDIGILKKYTHHMEIPLNFPDEKSEVNFNVVLHLLNFGHGYRHPLHDLRNAGAWKTMKRGVEELQKRSDSGIITAQTLTELSREKVVEVFDLGIRTQEGKRIADTTIELDSLVDMIVAVAHDSGRRLLDMGFPDFASFAYSHYRHPENGDPSATWLVHQLATCFPAFNDRRQWHGGMEVLFLKKAQIAVAELHQRFNDKNPAIFNFPDKDRLTVVCDNVLPCVLRTLGVLVLPDKLLQKIDSKQPLPAGHDEVELRATAITVAELMIEHGEGRFWAKELGDYLWSLGKDPHYRSVERHATPDTCFY